MSDNLTMLIRVMDMITNAVMEVVVRWVWYVLIAVCAVAIPWLFFAGIARAQGSVSGGNIVGVPAGYAVTGVSGGATSVEISVTRYALSAGSGAVDISTAPGTEVLSVYVEQVSGAQELVTAHPYVTGGTVLLERVPATAGTHNLVVVTL